MYLEGVVVGAGGAVAAKEAVQVLVQPPAPGLRFPRLSRLRRFCSRSLVHHTTHSVLTLVHTEAVLRSVAAW